MSVNRDKFNIRLSALTIAAALAGAGHAWATEPVWVTSGADSGEGTLRAALASGATNIRFGSRVGVITIDSTLVYEGSKPLRIAGLGQTIFANNSGDDFTLLEVASGANLSISRLNFDGGGGFSLDNPGAGKGVFVRVPTERTGVVNIELRDVRVSGVANHGVHVSDCTLGDDCGAGGGGGGDGSPASIVFSARRVSVIDAGNGKFDADGIRLDERNDGDIVFNAFASRFADIGADGVELDEGDSGDVVIDVNAVLFENNGGFCLDSPLELEQPCVEDDDGELLLDLDDGFDIDEAGPGWLLGSVSMSLVSDNLDEGLDFDVEGPGGADIEIRRVVAVGNGDEGIKLSEAGGDGATAHLMGVLVTGNGNDGIQIESENGDGTVHVIFSNSTSTGNDNDGLDLSQENTESPGTLRIFGFAEFDSLDLENVVEK
ncbi:MAG: hypothetical protein RQ741_12620 [Wenzhouxiangellaceae bacterium]|nr:hypothetical protein [Wenzhouxiangellaceae bacterium]